MFTRDKCKEKVASGGQGAEQVPTAAGQPRAELLVWCSLWELAQAEKLTDVIHKSSAKLTAHTQLKNVSKQ